MTDIVKQALLPFSQQQLFQLVNDVQSYPEFLPWCHDSEIISQDEHEMVARLGLKWKGFSKSFTTRNRFHDHQRIDLALVEGPFQRLNGSWQFDALGDLGCKISLSLSFEFNNRLISLAFAQVFEQIANSLVDSFCERANQLYG